MSKPRKRKKNAGKWYCDLADQYASETGNNKYEVSQVVNWAWERRKLDSSEQGIKEFHSRRLADALRQDTTEWNGQEVRVRYCTKNERPPLNDDQPKQQFLWAHVKDASPEFLRDAFQQLKKQVADDIEALKLNLAFVNESLVARNFKPIQMTFDFSDSDKEPPP